ISTPSSTTSYWARITDAAKAHIDSSTATITVSTAAGAIGGPGDNTGDRDSAFIGLTAQEHFVQALYLYALGRAGEPSELDAWVAVLNSPGGSQALVARGIEGSLEARDHLVKGWYVTFLGRQAQGGEELGWVGLLQSGRPEEEVLSQVLSDPVGHEFYD